VSGDWIAGAVRGRGLARHQLGSSGAERLGACHGIDDALAMLAGTTYERAARAGPNLEVVQHAVGAQALWHLRILAGWVPPGGVRVIQALAGWFEIANVEDMAVAALRADAGPPSPGPFELGRLSTLWRRARRSGTLAELREAVAATGWRDPGGDTVEDLLVGLWLGWAGLLHQAVAERREWGSGLAAMVLAQDRFLPGGVGRQTSLRRVQGVGDRWWDTTDLESYIAALPVAAAWVFAGVGRTEELWLAEETWWGRLAEDGADLIRTEQLGRGTVVGAAAVILADAHLTQVALSRAVRSRAEGRGHALV
jgi:hypothetical protein